MRRFPRFCPKCCSGFTLIELIITMIVVAILSAVVINRMSAQAQHSVTVQADQLRRNLSHIQLLAISRGATLRLTVAVDGYSYAAYTCDTSNCNSVTPLTDPATGLAFSVPLTDGVAISPTGNLDFDSLGRPQSNGSLIPTVPAQTYTLRGKNNCVQVSVRPITGFATAASPYSC